MKSAYLVLICGLVGGVLGYVAFFWLADQGFYGLVLPGGAVGLAAGFPRNRSLWAAVVCGVMATLLGLYTEWQFAPFRADGSLTYFLAHAHQLKPITWIMIGVGGVMGFWVPFRRLKDSPESVEV